MASDIAVTAEVLDSLELADRADQELAQQHYSTALLLMEVSLLIFHFSHDPDLLALERLRGKYQAIEIIHGSSPSTTGHPPLSAFTS